MFRFITVSMVMLLTVSSALAAINYDVKRAASEPVLDGVLDTGEWDDATAVTMAYPDIVTAPNEGTMVLGSDPNAADLSADIYLKWDKDYLYAAFRVYDQALFWRNNFPGPYNGQDAVQLCFNLLNDPAAVFLDEAGIFDIVAENKDALGPDVYKHDAPTYDPESALIASTLLADGYVIELGLAWDDFGYYQPRAGDQHGMMLMLLDYDVNVTGGDTLMTDGGNGSNVIGNPSAWNTMTLVNQDGCGANGLYEGDFNEDCQVDLDDFALLVGQWMDCTDPTDMGCTDLN